MQENQALTQDPALSVSDVTTAQIGDVPQLVSFVYSTYKEVGLHGAAPSTSKLLQEITETVVNHVAFVYPNKENPHFIDGAILFQYSSPFWSEQEVLKNLFIYVKPNARNKRVGIALIKAIKEFSDEAKIPVVMDIIGKNFKAKEKLFKRFGFEVSGTSLVYSPGVE